MCVITCTHVCCNMYTCVLCCVADTSPLRIEELCAGSVQQLPRQSAVHTNGQSSTTTSSCLHDNHAGSGDTVHQVAAGDRRIEAGSETKKHPVAASVSNGHDHHGVTKSDHQVVVDDDQCKERISKSDHRSTSTLDGNAERQRYASKSDHQVTAQAKMNRKSGVAGGRRDRTDRQRDVVDNSTYRVAAPVLVDRSAGDSGMLASVDLDGDLDESSFLNVSTISKMITSSSSNMKADDLVRQILRTSAAKKSCVTNEQKPRRVVHSASADSVHPHGISTDLQQREQQLSLRVEKIHSSEPSLVGLDGAGSGKRGKEKKGASGVRRKSSATRLPTPTYQRATVASAGRQEGQGKAGQSGIGKGEQGKQRRRQGARVGESSSSETTPREEALAERHCGTIAGKASECQSVDSNQTTDDAVDIDTGRSVSQRANTSVKQTGVKHKQGTPQPVHASNSTVSVDRMPGADGRERAKQYQVNSGRLSNSSMRVNAVSKTVNVDNESVNVVSERINVVSEKVNAGNERANAGNAKVGVVQNEERPSQHHDDTNGAVTDGMRAWEERERLPHESEVPERVNTEGGRDHTREGVESSPTGATVTDWEAPRASLAASLRLNQKQNGVEPNRIGANHSDDRLQQEVITDAKSSMHTNGGPVESFHHSLLPPAQQRASSGVGARPALLTGQALASTPFAVQYLDDLTGVTGLLNAYSDSSVSGTESESAAMVPRLSTLAIRDEFRSLPMSRPSVESQHEYDMRESFSPDVETMFATRVPMHHRNGTCTDW